MPTSSQHTITLSSQPSILVLKDNAITADEVTQPIETFSIAEDKVQPPLRETSIFVDGLKEFPKKERCTNLLLTVLLVSLTLLIMAIVATAIILPLALQKQTLTTTTTITTTTTTQTSTTTTTSVTTTSTTPSCVSPYVRAPSGICVDILLDFNNCGSVGIQCQSNYTSCSDGVCSTVPVVQLTGATSIWTGGINGSSDDDVFSVTLPFMITLYNTTTNQIQVTTNGVLCLSNCSNAWLESSLPSNSFGAAVLAYWDDLYIYSKTWQGIYFAPQGYAPNRTIVFEYYMSKYGFPTQFAHFQIIFFEAAPGVVQIIYLDASDGGVSCTVGVQNSNSGPFIQYSYDQANSVQPNMTLTFNTILGSYTNSSTIG